MDLTSDADETGHLGVGPNMLIPLPKIRMVPFDNKIISPARNQTTRGDHSPLNNFFPGPPFLFGALLVFMAILVNMGMPSTPQRGHRKHLRRMSSSGTTSTRNHLDTALLMAEEE